MVAYSTPKKRIYQTIAGRKLDFGKLNEKEIKFLTAVHGTYEKRPDWSAFASWWAEEFQRAGLPAPGSITYRICQDLEARLGIAQGKVSPPDYRDYLADLIEERYGSRYRFCKETGVDPGHLSRVFASRSELSLRTLQGVLEKLHAALVIQPEGELADRVSPRRAIQALTSMPRWRNQRQTD